MTRVLFYYQDGIINDATSFYVDLIEKAAKNVNFTFAKTKKLRDIKRNDIILTIYSRNFIEALITHPFNKTIFWAQGVEPEETLLYSNKLVYWIKSVMEFTCLKFSTLLFMVSDAMCEHYKNKYGLTRNNNIIMPCYNAERLSDIDQTKYDIPTFVFAGGASSWHCAAQIVETYKYIEEVYPNASITLLTSAKSQFEQILNKYQIKNYTIDYVPLVNLQKELSKYKYGFLLRESHIINKVATPTKMSSYLGAGIIPIYTDAISDFSNKINLGEFSLCYDTPINARVIADSIIEFEKHHHDYNKFNQEVNKVFNSYYSSSNYIRLISEKLIELKG